MSKLEEIKNRTLTDIGSEDQIAEDRVELLRRLEIADNALYAIRNADRGCFSQLNAALEAIRK